MTDPIVELERRILLVFVRTLILQNDEVRRLVEEQLYTEDVPVGAFRDWLQYGPEGVRP